MFYVIVFLFERHGGASSAGFAFRLGQQMFVRASVAPGRPVQQGKLRQLEPDNVQTIPVWTMSAAGTLESFCFVPRNHFSALNFHRFI